MAYIPIVIGPVQTLEELLSALSDELQRISVVVNAVELGHLEKTHVAPTKPRDGDIRYADGTDWNPGSGAGVYVYKATAWVLLG